MAAEVAAAGADEAVAAVVDLEADLHQLATSVGATWATEIVASLRSHQRDIIGAWPGTIREARMRVRGAIRVKLELPLLDELARVAYLSARRGWQEIAEPDPEP